jgi:hypothetical protein
VLLGVAAAVVAFVALVAEVLAPRITKRWRRRQARRRDRAQAPIHDPGRDRRAEQKARALLRSCVNPEDWEMYRELGFLRVLSTLSHRRDDPCAYLLYPHRPIVAYVPETRRFVGEYCISFEDTSRPYGSGRLPDSDDVLAKWMALTGDEHHLIAMANMHLPGRQVDPGLVERDLRRLAQWDQDRARRAAPAGAAAGGSVPRPGTTPPLARSAS